MDYYCVSCELLSASIADALLFLNILVSGIFHGRFAQLEEVPNLCQPNPTPRPPESPCRIESNSLTEREVSDPDEVGGEWELPEAVGGGEEVPPRDEHGAAPVERGVLPAHTNRRLPGGRPRPENGI